MAHHNGRCGELSACSRNVVMMGKDGCTCSNSVGDWHALGFESECHRVAALVGRRMVKLRGVAAEAAERRHWRAAGGLPGSWAMGGHD